MKLIHYTKEKFSLEPREYEQGERYWQDKPNGLWVSVEGEDDWKSWCEENEYRLHGVNVSYEVKLKDDDNILYLKTPEEIKEFSHFYRFNPRDSTSGDMILQIAWQEVKEKYQGIIIAPYQWDCRRAVETHWYYGWDCASGCIWDLDCIKEFKLQEQNDT